MGAGQSLASILTSMKNTTRRCLLLLALSLSTLPAYALGDQINVFI